MIASLHYLLRDTASAWASFNAAVANGESSPSATNLKRLFESKITCRSSKPIVRRGIRVERVGERLQFVFELVVFVPQNPFPAR